MTDEETLLQLAQNVNGGVRLLAAAGSVSREGQVHGLLVPASLGECVTPWKRQRTHVSFVRGIGPVALVLHLESVAFHPAGRPKPRRRFVRERADVEDWLRR